MSSGCLYCVSGDLPFQLRNLICSQDVVIQADDEIRLKIVGTRVDASGIVSNILYKQLKFCTLNRKTVISGR